MKDATKAYGEALFSLATKKGKVPEYAENLQAITEILREHPEYPSYLATPALPLSERLGAIEEAFGSCMQRDVVSFLKLLCEQNYITGLLDVIKEFFRLELESSNTVTVTVTSKIPLTDEQKEKLKTKLEAKYQKHISPVYQLDDSMLGGFTVTLEDRVIDASVSKRLQRMKEVIIL